MLACQLRTEIAAAGENYVEWVHGSKHASNHNVFISTIVETCTPLILAERVSSIKATKVREEIDYVLKILSNWQGGDKLG